MKPLSQISLFRQMFLVLKTYIASLLTAKGMFGLAVMSFENFRRNEINLRGLVSRLGRRRSMTSGLTSRRKDGFYCWHPGLGVLSDEDFQVLNRADGFPDDVVDSLSVDSRGRIFLLILSTTASYTFRMPPRPKGWTEISFLGQAYEFASRDGAQGLTFLVEGGGRNLWLFLGIGHGVIECIGEEASHRFEGEDGVKSSVDDAAMARDGYLLGDYN